MKKFIVFALLLIAITSHGMDVVLSKIPNPKTSNASQYVSNPDGLLKNETVNALNQLLDSLEKSTTTEVAVVVVKSIGNNDVRSFATELFKSWGIGKAQQDNGLLILFVEDQRDITFETGYGVEGILTDAICKRIQVQSMAPYFKAGDYDAGFIQGIKHTVSIVKNESFEKIESKPIAWNEVIPYALAAYLTIALLTFLWVNNAAQKILTNSAIKTNIDKYKSIKNQKDGIILLISFILPVIGFISILFLSNPWYIVLLLPIPLATVPANLYGKNKMRYIRKKPIACNECGGMMHILSEKEEDAYLKLQQQFEEELQSVDYDVFVCDTCKNEAFFTLDKPSAYSNCPKCNTKAFILKDKRTIIAPSYINSGTERTTYHCKFCGFENHTNRTLPRLTRTNNVIVGGSGGHFSGRGGFGGGGSFGGGMSGGGGASTRW